MFPEEKHIENLWNQVEKDNLLKNLIQQINKDVQLVGIDFELKAKSTPTIIVEKLNRLIIQLITYHFTDYVNLLYRIDIPEREILKLQGLEVTVLSKKVTFLLLQKEWQKVWFKNKHQ